MEDGRVSIGIFHTCYFSLDVHRTKCGWQTLFSVMTPMLRPERLPATRKIFSATRIKGKNANKKTAKNERPEEQAKHWPEQIANTPRRPYTDPSEETITSPRRDTLKAYSSAQPSASCSKETMTADTEERISTVEKDQHFDDTSMFSRRMKQMQKQQNYLMQRHQNQTRKETNQQTIIRRPTSRRAKTRSISHRRLDGWCRLHPCKGIRLCITRGSTWSPFPDFHPTFQECMDYKEVLGKRLQNHIRQTLIAIVAVRQQHSKRQLPQIANTIKKQETFTRTGLPTSLQQKTATCWSMSSTTRMGQWNFIREDQFPMAEKGLAIAWKKSNKTTFRRRLRNTKRKRKGRGKILLKHSPGRSKLPLQGAFGQGSSAWGGWGSMRALRLVKHTVATRTSKTKRHLF